MKKVKNYCIIYIVKIEMKGCFNMYKIPMGKFRGIPVYKVSYEQWYNSPTQDVEEIYVVDDEVFYHDQRIGYLDSNKQLEDFNEGLFSDLKSRYIAKREGASMPVEEMVPQGEETLDKESVDPGTAVDAFMSTWQDNIDNEIVRMKAEIAEMGVDFDAVG